MIRDLAVNLAVSLMVAVQLHVWRSIVEKHALLTERLPRGEVEIEGVGTVTVRGLSRYELLLAGKTGGDDVITIEQRMVSMGMVEPELTPEEVAQWQKLSPAGEIMPVLNEINRLSGIGREVQKEAYLAFRDQPGSGV